MAHTHAEQDLQAQLDKLKAGIREVAHEINNPLGVMRMALYMMQSYKDDKAKQEHYLELLNASIERIEEGLKRLRMLRENPAATSAGENPSTVTR
ncbi:MAG TPA: histidine kinase dimerization/phospho-acceptor domain-containing protein [Bacteroidota bacterium]|nr:histidine kinase dimerization/phospho-acceptor domain-containing protein [Bacteroidota bacterium]